MASFTKALLQTRLPFLIQTRFRGKINIQKPRRPYWLRQMLEDFSKPIYATPKHLRPCYELCDRGEKWKKEEIDNPFERILGNECLNWFNTSKMVVFVHINSMPWSEKTKVYRALKKNDMHLRNYGRKVVSLATTGTRYETVLQLFHSQQDIIFGQPENAAKLFKILKRTPQFVVMAGIVHDRLLSKNELVAFSQLPSLDYARSELCNVLQSAGTSLVGQLNAAPQTLVSYLDQHVNLQKEPKEETPSDQDQPQ